MNQLQAHKHITTALRRLEDGDSTKRILTAIKAGVEDLQDPFASEIDDFIKSKKGIEENIKEQEEAKKPDNPQDQSEDKLEDESIMPNSSDTSKEPQEQLEEILEDEGSVTPINTMDTDDISPQDKLEDNLKEEKGEADENKIDELEDEQKETDDEIDKLEKQTDEYIESSLKKIAQIAKNRGRKKLAYKIIKATSGGDINILNDLLMKEALKRDILLNYCFLFKEKSEEKNTATETCEMLCDRIKDIQGYIVKYHSILPATQRFAIPPVNPITPEAILKLVENLEAKSKEDYLAAIDNIEDTDETLSLKMWMRKIVFGEEGVKEIERVADVIEGKTKEIEII